MLRVVFFGTPKFAVPTLEALVASPHRIVGVVTQPDRPSGRGQRVAEPPVKTVARREGVQVWQPDRLRDDAWLDTFKEAGPDIGVVAAYGEILPQALLDIPARGFLNVHASLLPTYRGASPIQRAVMNGDPETGITIMRVVRALDAGPMLAKQARAIGPDETSEQVEADLAIVGAALLRETLAAVEAGNTVEIAQDEELATYAPRLTKDEGVIDWSLDAAAIHNMVRGLRPWPLAFTYLRGTRLTFLRGRAATDRGRAGTTDAPGTIVEAHGDLLSIHAGNDTIYQAMELQPEGRRAMTTREFLAGHHVEAGERLTSVP